MNKDVYCKQTKYSSKNTNDYYIQHTYNTMYNTNRKIVVRSMNHGCQTWRIDTFDYKRACTGRSVYETALL